MLVGSDGTISSYDYDDFVTLQTRADAGARAGGGRRRCRPGRRGPVEYVLARIADGGPIEGPLDPTLCLIGQRMIDSAVRSAAEKRTVPLVP